jgi:hypothetical protein
MTDLAPVKGRWIEEAFDGFLRGVGRVILCRVEDVAREMVENRVS